MVKLLVFHPRSFFASVRKETGYYPAWKFNVVLMLAGFFLGIVAKVVPVFLSTPSYTQSASFILPYIFGFAFIFVIPFISAGIIHLGVLITGGRGYLGTFKVVTYASVIGVFYGFVLSVVELVVYLASGFSYYAESIRGNLSVGFWLMFLSIMTVFLVEMIHITVLSVIGLREIQKLSTGKAVVAAVVVPLCIFIVFIMIMFAIGLLIGFVSAMMGKVIS